MQKRVAFYTLGCKLNFSETSAIARAFAESGYQKVGFEQAAEVYVINTCSVTENADKKCRNITRKALRQSPEAKVVVVGCYAQLQPEEIAQIPGVDLVLGAGEKFNVVAHLEELADKESGCQVHAGNIEDVDFYEEAWSMGDRTRTFLKVQDGCDYNCAFCTIPLARGRSRSKTIASVLENAQAIAATDVKEVVLTGVNIGDFGKGPQGDKRPNESFYDLVKALDEVEGIERFRISSIEPNLLNDNIIAFVAQSQRFMPHFHVPLQSGSDTLLKSMRRRYLSDLYVSRVDKIKNLMPDACIGVDVIVGFPGETEEEFLTTYRFLNELDVSYLHVFTYSERPDTQAVEMEGIVPVVERRKRSKMLRTLSEKKKRYFYEQFVGQVRPALLEGDNNEGWMHGFTDNYIKVKLPYKAELVNTMVHVHLNELTADGEMLVQIVSRCKTQVERQLKNV